MLIKPMIYRTRGEHANHYTTDAVASHDMAEKLLKVMINITYPYVS
jgi:hypothetical protein